MKKLWSVFMAVSLFASVSLGQEPKKIETVPEGADRIVSVKKGAEAPFEGQLFDNDTALRWANWLRQYKLRLKVDVEEQQQLCAVRLESAAKLREAETARYRKVEAAYALRVQELQYRLDNPPWYSSPTFYVVVGVVSATAAIAGGYALGSSF